MNQRTKANTGLPSDETMAATSESGKKRRESKWAARRHHALNILLGIPSHSLQPVELLSSLLSSTHRHDLDALKVEAYLLESWHEACVLRLPLLQSEKVRAHRSFVHLRRKASAQPDPTPAAFTNDELLGWLHLLQKYVRQLGGKMAQLQDFGEPPEEAVLLATIAITAIRVVKKFLGHKSREVPWEEMEFLLVEFVRSSTSYVSESFAVATPTRLRKYLALFACRVEQVVKDWWVCGTDLKKLYQWSDKFKASQNRGMFVKELMQSIKHEDEDLQGLHRDFEVLRDLHSLRKIIKALNVALKVLRQNNDMEWKRRGRRALRRALFVVGEYMKGTWMSPNLSAQSASVIEVLVNYGVVDRFTDTRDKLAHPKGQRPVPERPRELKADLETVKRIAKAQLESLAIVFVEKFCVGEVVNNLELRIRFMSIVSLNNNYSKVEIIDEMLKELESIMGEAGTSEEGRETVRKSVKSIKSEAVTLRETIQNRIFHICHPFYTPPPLLSSRQQIENTILMALEGAPPRLKLRALRLLRMCLRDTTGLDRVVSDLSSPKKEQTKSSTVECIQDLRALQRLEEKPNNLLTIYATLDILMETATPGKEDLPTPVTSLWAPGLFGVHLRNFLHHDDTFINVCLEPGLQVNAQVVTLLRLDKDLDALCATKTRWRGWKEAEQDYDCFLGLARDKDKMFAAARRGDLGTVKRFAEKIPVNARDPQHRSLLHAAAEGTAEDSTAAQKGRQDVVQWLLRQVEPEGRDWMAQTPLHVTTTEKIAADLIVYKPDLNTSPMAVAMRIPLHRAAGRGLLGVLRRMLLDSRVDVDTLDQELRTPLHLAALGGHDGAVELLLSRGAAASRPDKDKDSPLVFAAISGSKRCVELLLQKEPSDEQYRKAVLGATDQGHADACLLLLNEQGKQSALQELRSNLLRRAVTRGNASIVERVLKEWPKALYDEDEYGGTALHYAAEFGHDEVVRVLLSASKDSDQSRLKQNSYGRIPLACAPMRGHVSTLKLLMDGIDKQAAPYPDTLESIMHFAATYGNEAVVEYLIEEGIDVDVNRGCGFHLHCAARNGHAAIVKLLLRHGASYRLSNSGLTPLYFAACGDHAEVLRAFLSQNNHEVTLELLDIENKDKKSALDGAVIFSSFSAVNCLLDAESEALKGLRRMEKTGKAPQHTMLKEYVPLAFRTLGESHVLVDAVRLFCSVDIIERLLNCLEDDGKVLRRAGNKTYVEVRDMAVMALGCAVKERHEEAAVKLRDWLKKAERDEGMRLDKVKEREGRALTDSWFSATTPVWNEDGEITTHWLMEPDSTSELWSYLKVGRADLWGYATESLIRNARRKLYKDLPVCEIINNMSYLAELVLPDYGVLPAALHDKDKWGRTALHRAALFGRDEQVRLLLGENEEAKKRGGDLRLQRDKADDTPLHCATFAGHKSTLQLLVDFHDPKVSELTASLLCDAASYGHEDIVEYLLDKGADVDAEWEGMAPLHLAVREGREAVVRLLLARGARQGPDKHGLTPLHAAAAWRDEAMLRALLPERGQMAPPQPWHEAVLELLQGEREEEQSALDFAVYMSALLGVECLLEVELEALKEMAGHASAAVKYVPFAFRSHDEHPALTWAVKWKCPLDIIKRLLKCLENDLLRSTAGRTYEARGMVLQALGWAAIRENAEVAGVLRGWLDAAQRRERPMAQRALQAELPTALKGKGPKRGGNPKYLEIVGSAHLWGYQDIVDKARKHSKNLT